MTTQNEIHATYDYQSFDDYAVAPMYPHGWNLSEMQSSSKEVEASDAEEDNETQA
jgi:hypothetical protein